MTIQPSLRFAIPSFALALLAGCYSDAFTRPPLPVLDRPNARTVQADFAVMQADKFTSTDSVIIKAPFRDDLAVLGVVQVDRKAGTFEVVGMNQMGLELFHLTGDRNGTNIQSAIPPLMEQKLVLLSIGQDIYRMFFDLAPPVDANFEVKSTIIRYEAGDVIYEFGGKPIVLLDKHVQGFFGDKWHVRFYDYAEIAGHLYPRGIVMDNGHYHYQVVIKNRDWQSD